MEKHEEVVIVPDEVSIFRRTYIHGPLLTSPSNPDLKRNHHLQDTFLEDYHRHDV
jgi:hypothetical protein